MEKQKVVKIDDMGIFGEYVGNLKTVDIENRKWVTIGRCLDAPVPLRQEVKRLKKLGYCAIWFFHPLFGKRIVD